MLNEDLLREHARYKYNRQRGGGRGRKRSSEGLNADDSYQYHDRESKADYYKDEYEKFKKSKINRAYSSAPGMYSSLAFDLILRSPSLRKSLLDKVEGGVNIGKKATSAVSGKQYKPSGLADAAEGFLSGSGSLPIGATYMGLRGMSNINRSKRLAYERQHAPELGIAGKGSRAMDAFSNINRLTYSMPLAYSMMGKGLGLNSSMWGGPSMWGAMGLGGMAGMMGAGIGLSVWKNYRLKNIRAGKQDPLHLQQKYSTADKYDSALSQLASSGKLEGADQAKISLLQQIERHVSTIPHIASIVDYTYQSKNKQKSSEKGYENLYTQEKMTPLDKVEKFLNSSILKYDPITQLLTFLTTGKTPRNALKDIQSAYPGKNKGKFEKEKAIQTGLSMEGVRLLHTKSSQVVATADTYESKMLNIARAQLDVSILSARSLVAIRQSLGVERDVFNYQQLAHKSFLAKIFESLSNIPSKISSAISHIPGLAAVQEVLKIPYSIGQGLSKLSGVGKSLFQLPLAIKDWKSKGLFRLSKDPDRFDKELGIYKTDQERANTFLGTGLPEAVSKSLMFDEMKIKLLRNIYQVLKEAHNIQMDDTDLYQNRNIVWDATAEKFSTEEDRLHLSQSMKMDYAKNKLGGLPLLNWIKSKTTHRNMSIDEIEEKNVQKRLRKIGMTEEELYSETDYNIPHYDRNKNVLQQSKVGKFGSGLGVIGGLAMAPLMPILGPLIAAATGITMAGKSLLHGKKSAKREFDWKKENIWDILKNEPERDIDLENRVIDKEPQTQPFIGKHCCETLNMRLVEIRENTSDDCCNKMCGYLIQISNILQNIHSFFISFLPYEKQQALPEPQTENILTMPHRERERVPVGETIDADYTVLPNNTEILSPGPPQINVVDDDNQETLSHQDVDRGPYLPIPSQDVDRGPYLPIPSQDVDRESFFEKMKELFFKLQDKIKDMIYQKINLFKESKFYESLTNNSVFSTITDLIDYIKSAKDSGDIDEQEKTQNVLPMSNAILPYDTSQLSIQEHDQLSLPVPVDNYTSDNEFAQRLVEIQEIKRRKEEFAEEEEQTSYLSNISNYLKNIFEKRKKDEDEDDKTIFDKIKKWLLLGLGAAGIAALFLTDTGKDILGGVGEIIAKFPAIGVTGLAAIGATGGFAVGGIPGAIVGGLLGGAFGTIAPLFSDDIELKQDFFKELAQAFNTKIGRLASTVSLAAAGGMLGMNLGMIGGPMGMLYGSIIGTLLGGALGYLAPNILNAIGGSINDNGEFEFWTFVKRLIFDDVKGEGIHDTRLDVKKEISKAENVDEAQQILQKTKESIEKRQKHELEQNRQIAEERASKSIGDVFWDTLNPLTIFSDLATTKKSVSNLITNFKLKSQKKDIEELSGDEEEIQKLIQQRKKEEKQKAMQNDVSEQTGDVISQTQTKAMQNDVSEQTGDVISQTQTKAIQDVVNETKDDTTNQIMKNNGSATNISSNAIDTIRSIVGKGIDKTGEIVDKSVNFGRETLTSPKTQQLIEKAKTYAGQAIGTTISVADRGIDKGIHYTAKALDTTADVASDVAYTAKETMKKNKVEETNVGGYALGGNVAFDDFTKSLSDNSAIRGVVGELGPEEFKVSKHGLEITPISDNVKSSEIQKEALTDVTKDAAIQSGALAALNFGEKKALKLGGRQALKFGGKQALKTTSKKIPLLGILAGTAFAIDRLKEQDYLGAFGELASGVASTLPLIGTGVSLGIDSLLMASDYKKAVQEHNDKVSDNDIASTIKNELSNDTINMQNANRLDLDEIKKSKDIPFDIQNTFKQLDLDDIKSNIDESKLSNMVANYVKNTSDVDELDDVDLESSKITSQQPIIVNPTQSIEQPNETISFQNDIEDVLMGQIDELFGLGLTNYRKNVTDYAYGNNILN